MKTVGHDNGSCMGSTQPWGYCYTFFFFAIFNSIKTCFFFTRFSPLYLYHIPCASTLCRLCFKFCFVCLLWDALFFSPLSGMGIFLVLCSWYRSSRVFRHYPALPITNQCYVMCSNGNTKAQPRRYKSAIITHTSPSRIYRLTKSCTRGRPILCAALDNRGKPSCLKPVGAAYLEKGNFGQSGSWDVVTDICLAFFAWFYKVVPSVYVLQFFILLK